MPIRRPIEAFRPAPYVDSDGTERKRPGETPEEGQARRAKNFEIRKANPPVIGAPREPFGPSTRSTSFNTRINDYTYRHPFG